MWKWLNRLWIASLLLAFVIMPLACCFLFFYQEEGEHLPRVSWLPAEATDVDYHFDSVLRVFECRISESGFLALARERGWDVRPIKEDVRLIRASQFIHHEPSPREEDFPGDQDRYVRAFEAWDARRTAVFRDGYMASTRDGDQGYIVAYDRAAGRGHYLYSSR